MLPNKQLDLTALAKRSGIILLYHSIADTVPQALSQTLHNVTAEVLKNHLLELTQHFKVVSLTEFAQARQKNGLLAVTFDDGYKNVLTNAMPVLVSFEVPFTIFLNTLTLAGQWNWRDKVRYLIHHRLVEDFCAQTDFKFQFDQGRFYRFSKHPLNNSLQLDRALDRYLGGRDIDLYAGYPYLTSDDLVDHPLLSYGNHSVNHYVLSSLTNRQQKDEVINAKKHLHCLRDIRLVDGFSAPFGGDHDVDEHLLNVVDECAYSYLLMSRQRLQPAQAQSQAKSGSVQLLERFMPRSDSILSEISL